MSKSVGDSSSPSHGMRLIPSHKKALLVPPPLEPTAYRIPRLMKDSDSDTAPPSRDSNYGGAASGSARKQVRIVEGLAESSAAAGPTATAADGSSNKPRQRNAFEAAGRSDYGRPATPSRLQQQPSAAAASTGRPQQGGIGIRTTSPRRHDAPNSPPHQWAQELDALMRSRDLKPQMEEFDGSGNLALSRAAEGSSQLWGVYDDGTDVWNTSDANRRSPRRRSPHHRQRKLHSHPTAMLEWIMSARQHEVLAHNGVKWKSPGEAYGSATRPTMYHVDAQNRSAAAAGRARTPTGGRRAVSPKRALPASLTGVERLRQLSTDNVYEDRREHALLQEKRRRNASRVLAQMRSLSPRRREASPVTVQEKSDTFSESARWFGNPGAVLGTPRPQPRDNGVPGPGYYELPRTFGAGFPL